MTPLGDRLRSARQLRRLSREDVAEQIGVPAKAQARLERNEVHSSKYLPDLLAFYGFGENVETVAVSPAAATQQDPPLSQATFTQAWLRVLELWLESRPGDTTSLATTAGDPPSPQVMDALNTIKVTLVGESDERSQGSAGRH